MQDNCIDLVGRIADTGGFIEVEGSRAWGVDGMAVYSEVQDNCIDLVGRIADRGGFSGGVPGQEEQARLSETVMPGKCRCRLTSFS